MTKKISRRSKAAAPSASDNFAALGAALGDPPLLPGEDRAAYDELHDRLMADTKPLDAIEYIWVREFTDLTWQILRLRRYLTALSASRLHQGLERILTPRISSIGKMKDLVSEWARRDEESLAVVEELMGQFEFSNDTIEAETFVSILKSADKIENLMSVAEAKRTNIIREIGRRRETLARQLTLATQAEEADFRVIGSEDVGQA